MRYRSPCEKVESSWGNAMKWVAGCFVAFVVFILLMVALGAGLRSGGDYLKDGYLKIFAEPTRDPLEPTAVPELGVRFIITDSSNWKEVKPGKCTGTGIAADIHVGQIVTVTSTNAGATPQTDELMGGGQTGDDGCHFVAEVTREEAESYEITIGEFEAVCPRSNFADAGPDLTGYVFITDDGPVCDSSRVGDFHQLTPVPATP